MATVDVTQFKALAGTWRVQMLPTTVFLVNGKEVNRIEGQTTREDLLAGMAQAFKGGAPAAPAAAAPTGPAAAPPSGGGVPTWGLVAGGVVVAGIVGYFVFR
jgi:thioredoxin-like negative regulator of GroEL